MNKQQAMKNPYVAPLAEVHAVSLLVLTDFSGQHNPAQPGDDPIEEPEDPDDVAARRLTDFNW